MDDKAWKILLIEKQSADDAWVNKILRDCNEQIIQLESIYQFQNVADAVGQSGYDILLFSYTLDQSQDLDKIELLQQKAPQLPIIILSAENNSELAVRLMRQGVQDYLVREELEPKTLV
ncbi:MAG: response regulator, partial [Cyanobacteria bacterium J06631_2]